MMHYKTHGTCSTAIDLEIEGGKITSRASWPTARRARPSVLPRQPLVKRQDVIFPPSISRGAQDDR